MRRVILAALAGLLAAPAMAQTTTTCLPTGTMVECETTPSGSAQFANGVSALANALAVRKQRKQIAVAFVQALQEGRCDEARALAVQFGDTNDLKAVAQCQQAANQAQREAAAREDAWRMGIAQAIQEGRCDDAKASALGAGRLDVADQVLRLCTPKR